MSDHPLGRVGKGNQSGDLTRSILRRFQVDLGPTRMVLLLVTAFAFFSLLKPSIFLSQINLQNIAIASPEVGVLAVAMMLTMLTGGIDLSLVSIANLSAITMSTMFTNIANDNPDLAEMSMPIIVLTGVLVGLIAGAINGYLISSVGITPILATLGTMQIYNGLAIVWTGGSTLYGSPSGLSTFGKNAIAGIPLLFVALIATALAVGFLVNKTSIGRKIQLQGANPTASRYSGINSHNVLMSTYTTAGALGGLAGVLFLARNPTASADYGASYVLLVIVIAVLGGTNPVGGFASVTGVVLAALTLQVVASGFTAIRLSSFEYAIAQGVILIAVMIVDSVDWSSRKRQVRKPGVKTLATTHSEK